MALLSGPSTASSQEEIEIFPSEFVTSAFKMPDENGKLQPFSFQGREYLLPIYDTPSRRVLLKFARQSEKTTLVGNKILTIMSLRDYFRNLYVAPRQDQTETFSKDRLALPIQTSKVLSEHLEVVKGALEPTDNVKYKQFRNGSSVTLRSAFLNADNSRGLAIDHLVVDESIRVGTLVDTPTGSRTVETFRPGDPVVSFDEEGYLHEDEIVACMDHGVRDCYRFEFSNGAALELTSDSWMATTDGWKRTATAIADACAGAAATRNDVGRQPSLRSEQESTPRLEARLGAARVQLPQVPGAIRVRTHAAQEGEERRLRRMVQLLGDTDLSGALAYRVLVSPRRQEACDTAVVGPTDLGRDRVVVHGRRQSVRTHGNLSHGGLHAGRGRAACTGAVQPRPGSHGAASAVAARQQQVVPHHCAFRGSDVPAGGAYRAVRAPGDGVQARARYAAAAHLPLVCKGLRARARVLTRALQAQRTAGLLWHRGVQPASQTGYAAATPREAGGARTNACRAEGALPRNTGVFTRVQTRGGCTAVRSKPGSQQGAQAARTGQAASSAPARNLAVPTLSGDRGARRQARQQEVLCSVRAACRPGEQDGVPTQAHGCAARGESDLPGDVLLHLRKADAHSSEACPNLAVQYEVQAGARGPAPEHHQVIAPGTLLHITWTGRHRVFDLEVKKHSTFIAGGVAVHNCQDILVDALPVLEETLKHSPHKYMTYAGTPKSVDNTIEYYWENFSTQYEWAIPCDACGSKFRYRHWIVVGYDNIGRKGLICDRCGEVVHVQHADAQWVSARSAAWLRDPPLSVGIPFEGYRISQAIVPWLKWADILDSKARYPIGKFMNEVLGLAYDSGDKLLKRSTLEASSDTAVLMSNAHKYVGRTPLYMGIDWGGGSDLTSFTVVVIGGYFGDYFQVLYMKRFEGAEGEYERLMPKIEELAQTFRVHLIGADYGGGLDKNDRLIRTFGIERVLRYQYTNAKKLYFDGPLMRYMANRTEILMMLINAINRMTVIKFPRWEDWEFPHADDLLAVHSEYNRAGNTMTVSRSPGKADDTLHALAYCLLSSMAQHPRPDLLSPDKDR